MSDLLSTLAQQTLGLAAVVQPRVTSRFGPVPLVLADAQIALPAPSEPSTWGPPPPGLLSGADAQASLFSWRQMQDAAVSEDAVAPVLDSEGIDTAEPLDESVTTLSSSPMAPEPQPSAGDVTTQRLVTEPVAGPAVPPGLPRPHSNQEPRTLAVEKPVAEPESRRVTSAESDLAAAVGWAAAAHPAAQDPIQATGAAAFAALQTLDVPPVSAATVGPPVPSPAAQQPIDRSTRAPLEHGATPGSAPGHSTSSGRASEPATNLRTTAGPTAALSDVAQLTSAVPGSAAGEELALPVPATSHWLETAPGAPGVSLQTTARTASSPTEAGQPAAAPAAGQPMDGTSSVVPPVLVQAPLAMAGSAMNAELAPSSPATIQRQVEASTLAPVAHAPVFAGTPGSTATADPSMVTPTTFQQPVEVAANTPPAPGPASEVGLTALVVDEPVPAALQPAAATDAPTPVTPAPAVARAALAVPPGPAPVVVPHTADAPGKASYVTGLMPIDEPVVDRAAASLAMLPNATVTTDRNTTVVDQPAASTAAAQWSAQAAAATPLTPALATPDTVAHSGIVEPPGPVPSAGLHAGETFVDAIAPPLPHASPAESRITTGAATAAPVSTASSRISTTAVLVPGMPSPAPAAAAGATGPVNPVAPASSDIQSLTQTASLAAVPPARPSVASEWTVTADPAGSVPGANAAEIQIAAPVALAGAAIASTVNPVVDGQVTPGTAVVQRTAEPSALAPGAPAGPPPVQPSARIPAAIPRAAVPAAVTPAELAPIPVTPFSTTAPAGPAARMSDTTQPPVPVPSMAPAAANLRDHTAALPGTDPRMVETTATAPQTRSAAPAGTAITVSSATVPATALHRGETPGLAPVRQSQTPAPGDETTTIQRTAESALAAPAALADAPATLPSATVPAGPAAHMPDAAQPPAPVLPMAEAALAHTPVVTAGRTSVTGPAAPSGAVAHLTEGPATSRAEPLPGSSRASAQTIPAGHAAAQHPAHTPAVAQQADLHAPPAAPAAANSSDHTAVVPAASLRLVETPATALGIPIAAPAGTTIAGSLAPVPAAALQSGETPGLAPVMQTQATAPDDMAVSMPAASQSTIMTRGAHAPAPRAAPGDAAAADPVAPRRDGGPSAGETTVAAPVADTQAPVVVSSSTAAPGLVAPRPAAANPNVDTPVAHSPAPGAPSGISQAAAQHDPTLAAVARVTETAAITPAGLPQAPAATIEGTDTTGSASSGPMDSLRVTGTAAPAPTVPTAAPRVTVDTSPVALITANFPGTASAPAPGKAVGPAAIQPRVRRGRGDSELVAPAEARRSPTTMPGSITPHDQATPVPTTATGVAATARTAAAISPVPGVFEANHLALSMPGTVARAVETAVAPAASRHAPIAVRKDMVITNPPVPISTTEHQPNDPPAPLPTVLNPAPTAASKPATTDHASSPTTTPTSHPTNTPAIVPGAPPYPLLPTPYSLLPTPYSLLRITIGRIDVRVTAPPPPASTRREPTRPTVSLDDYLSGVGSPP